MSNPIEVATLEEVLASSLVKRSPTLRNVLVELKSRWENNQGAWPAGEMSKTLYPKAPEAADMLRIHIRRTRTLLNRFYVWKEQGRGDLCVVIERGTGGYQLVFRAYPADYSGHELQAVDRFWSQLWKQTLENSRGEESKCRIYIVFPNEVELKRNSKLKGLWTGTGEVVGCYFLGRLFAKLFPEHEVDPELIRSASIEERLSEENRIFIFVGSSLAISSLWKLRDHPILKPRQRFFFDWSKDAAGQTVGILRDTMPEQKDLSEYSCKTESDWSYVDYALVSYFYDKDQNQSIVALGAISTLGTEQAVKILSDNTNGYMAQIFAKLNQTESAGNKVTDFEALFRVEIRRSIPIRESTLVKFSTPRQLRKRNAAAK